MLLIPVSTSNDSVAIDRVCVVLGDITRHELHLKYSVMVGPIPRGPPNRTVWIALTGWPVLPATSPISKLGSQSVRVDAICMNTGQRCQGQQKGSIVGKIGLCWADWVKHVLERSTVATIKSLKVVVVITGEVVSAYQTFGLWSERNCTELVHESCAAVWYDFYIEADFLLIKSRVVVQGDSISDHIVAPLAVQCTLNRVRVSAIKGCNFIGRRMVYTGDSYMNKGVCSTKTGAIAHTVIQ